MLSITLPPELEYEVKRKALEYGTTAEQIVLETLHRNLLSPVSEREEQTAWVIRLRRIATPAGVSLSEDVLTREALYE